MTGNEIKKTDVMKLVTRLFEIDSKLCPDTAMDVVEYNVIIEEIWNMISDDKKETKEKQKRRVRTK